MARMPRLKVLGEAAWYHLYAAASVYKGEYPLAKPRCQAQLLQILRFYLKAYCCGVASYSFMGNHVHYVVHFEAPRKLSSAELWERALAINPGGEIKLKNWSKRHWNRFQERVFDVSEFMRNLQSAFGKWYNETFERKGRFWGERFKSTLLADGEAVREAVLYVDLNGFRAGLVARPEEYKHSSAYLREQGRDEWLLPPERFMDHSGKTDPQKLYREYKALLYYRGEVPTKGNQAALDPALVAREQARGFATAGTYKKPQRYFTCGMMLGGEGVVREQIVRLRETGKILRRKNPTEQAVSRCFSLREQRRHFVPLK